MSSYLRLIWRPSGDDCSLDWQSSGRPNPCIRGSLSASPLEQQTLGFLFHYKVSCTAGENSLLLTFEVIFRLGVVRAHDRSGLPPNHQQHPDTLFGLLPQQLAQSQIGHVDLLLRFQLHPIVPSAMPQRKNNATYNAIVLLVFVLNLFYGDLFWSLFFRGERKDTIHLQHTLTTWTSSRCGLGVLYVVTSGGHAMTMWNHAHCRQSSVLISHSRTLHTYVLVESIYDISIYGESHVMNNIVLFRGP